MSDRNHIVLEWLARAEQFWILSRVGVHEFGFLFPGMHLHALAVEMMLKAAILTIDPAGSSYSTVSVRTFPERHHIMKLIKRWNALNPPKRISQKLDGILGWNDSGSELLLSERSFEALAKYTEQEMVGRYFEGSLQWNAWAVDAANVVFTLRRCVLDYLEVDHDFSILRSWGHAVELRTRSG